MKARRPSLLLVIMAVCGAAGPCAAGGAKDAPSPFARLFDTRVPLGGPVTAELLTRTPGWKAVAGAGHEFAGDAVFFNDKAVVVLTKAAGGASVYSRTPTAVKLRTTIGPRGGKRLAGVKVIESAPAAVAVEASFDTGRRVTLRLTAGVPLIEVKPAAGVAALSIRDAAEHVVVPDFFADDMVFSAGAFPAGKVGLPAENCFVSLLDSGSAAVVYVLRSNEQDVDVVFGRRGGRIAGCEVDCSGGRGLWVGLLAGAGIWHGRKVAAGQGGGISVDHKPPFAGRWRCDLVGAAGVAESIDLPAGGALRPVRIKSPSSLVIYPLDRSRSTPLTKYCLIDVLRNALGVGPCQYVLEVEGLGAESPATTDQVTHWVERQFERKRAQRQAETIKQRLGEMTRHVVAAEKRIAEYSDFADALSRQCQDHRRREGASQLADDLLSILDGLGRQIASRPSPADAGSAAERLATGMADLIGRPGALAQCKALGGRLRSLGAAQDRALAVCRMALRRLRQRCRTGGASEGPAAELAGRVRTQAEKMLRRK